MDTEKILTLMDSIKAIEKEIHEINPDIKVVFCTSDDELYIGRTQKKEKGKEEKDDRFGEVLKETQNRLGEIGHKSIVFTRGIATVLREQQTKIDNVYPDAVWLSAERANY